MAGPTSVVAPVVRGKVARTTLVDACGNPIAANSMYVTDSVVQVTSTKNMDMGDEIKVRQMNGIIGEYEPGQASLLNYTVAVQFIKCDPGLLAALTGDPAILDYAGKAVGFSERALQLLTKDFALELWNDTSGTACQAGSRLYGYMLYSMIGHGYTTIDNITDKEVTFTVNGMTFGSFGWGRGPYGSGTVATRTVADAVTTGTNTSPIITSATAAFVAGDVGKLIVNPQFPAGTYIVSVTNATTAVMSANAAAAGTAESLTIGVNDGSSVSGPVAVSANNTPGRLLVAADPTEHREFQITPIAPPAAQTPTAGPQTITLPSPY